MIKRTSRKSKKDLRHKRVRKKVKGSGERPRLSVFKSARHIYAQIIDDSNNKTLASASTLTPKVKEQLQGESQKKQDAAKAVGKYIAEISLSIDIKEVSFDRGGFPYHGRVKALADAAREAGLKF
jgi:large subunit ribosomal protein L18